VTTTATSAAGKQTWVISFLVRIFALYIAECFDPIEQACDGPRQRLRSARPGRGTSCKGLDCGERLAVEWKVDGLPGLR
jgi:hypothetical protein